MIYWFVKVFNLFRDSAVRNLKRYTGAVYMSFYIAFFNDEQTISQIASFRCVIYSDYADYLGQR